MLTGDNETVLANLFWECFCVTCLPVSTDYEKLKIICTDLDRQDRKKEIQNLIEKFNKGWLPDDEDKNEK